MGVCFSFSASSPPPPPTAKLISLTGDLHHYPPFISVTQVLTNDTTSAASDDDFFICNSDFLSYDDPIPALGSDTMLLPNQLYFLLPISMLNSTLTAPQMASLAVTASHALQISSPTTKSTTISPLLFLDHHLSSSSSSMLKLKEPAARQIRRSGSIKKLQRYASRRAKLAVGSFKLRMATIYEGTGL